MTQDTPNSYRGLLISLVAALALAGGITASWLAQRGSSSDAPEFDVATALLERARPLPEFSLTDQNGDKFDNTQLEGKWSFMFFGYTSCPDICPATLSMLDRTVDLLGQEHAAEDVQVVFVSVDPWRDDSSKLASYMKYFNPEFIGATGEADHLEQLTTPLGILFNKLQPDGDDNYLVDHSASILLAGPDGKLQAVFSVPHDPPSIASDFKRLRQYYSKS